MDRPEEPIPSFYDDLDQTLAEIWRRLARGAVDRRSGFHAPALATVGADGRPEIRTVVLRRADPTSAKLFIHTDIRSAKTSEIVADPRVSVHFYDPSAKIQLRLAANASLHRGDAIAATAWERTQRMSRICYQIMVPPGSSIAHPADIAFDAEQTRDGAASFCVVALAVTAIEYLYLAAAGHRRARFAREPDGPFRGGWLVP